MKKNTADKVFSIAALILAAAWVVLFFSALFKGNGLSDAPESYWVGFVIGILVFLGAIAFVWYAAKSDGLFKLGKEWLNGLIPAVAIVISGLLTILPVIDNNLNSTWYSPFWGNGKLKDPQDFIKRFDDQYNFDQDTALKNYIIKYRELPGINLHDGLIRSGVQKPSTAPRAYDYDFKYPDVTVGLD
jgi:hypothetical protein